MARTHAAAVGRIEFEAFAAGWHAQQFDARCGVPYRAADGCGTVRLARQRGAHRICVLLSGPAGIGRGGAASGEIEVDGRAHPVELRGDWWCVRRVPLAAGGEEEVSVRFRLRDAPCPDDVLHNGDLRRLGWYVSAVWQE